MKQIEAILLGSFKNKYSLTTAFLLSILLAFVYDLVDFSFFFISIVVINAMIAISLIKNRMGLIPSARYLFLVSPGFLQCFFWYISKGDIRVAFLANDYLTENIIRLVAIFSTVAAASATLGFSAKPFILKMYLPAVKITKRFTIVFYILFALVAIYYARTIGESLLTSKVYASGTEDPNPVRIGTLNVFFFFFFSLFFFYRFWMTEYTRREKIFYICITLCIITYVALRGVRQDSIGFLLAIFSISYASKLQFKGKPLYYFVFFLFCLSWLGSLFSGLIRSDFTFETLQMVVGNPFVFFFSIRGNYPTVNLDTASMTIGTLNVIPYKIEEQGYLLGKTFIDWLPRTFPQFMLPSRPEDPAYEMHYNGDWFGWGGIHEAAEEYWNFGFIGVIILPFLFSYLINSLGKSFIRSGSFFSAIPIVWLIMMPRWIWYQVFALYKSTFVMCLIIYFLYFCIMFFTQRTSRVR